METGTDKTSVYLRTAFELNRGYGFLKFIVLLSRAGACWTRKPQGSG